MHSRRITQGPKKEVRRTIKIKSGIIRRQQGTYEGKNEDGLFPVAQASAKGGERGQKDLIGGHLSHALSDGRQARRKDAYADYLRALTVEGGP